MPSINIKPRKPCKIQRIFDIDIEPRYEHYKSDADNNKLFNFLFEQNRERNLDIASGTENNFIHRQHSIDIHADVHTPAVEVSPKPQPTDIPETNLSNSNSNSFIDAITIHSGSSEAAKTANWNSRPKLSANDPMQLMEYNDDSDPMCSTEPMIDLDFTSRDDIVQDFIRDVLHSEGYVSPSSRLASKSSLLNATTDQLMSPKAVLQRTIDQIRNDKTTLDMTTLNVKNEMIENISSRSLDALSPLKTATSDREIQCNLVPPLNLPASRHNDVADMQTVNTTFDRAFDYRINSDGGLETASSIDDILPHSIARQQHKFEQLNTPPNAYATLENSPKFARTINSIRNSARSHSSVRDRRSATYRNASDREIQQAAERFLLSVKKQNHISHPTRAHLNMTLSSSDSEEDPMQPLGGRGKCQIVGDQVIQSNFTNILTDDEKISGNDDNACDVNAIENSEYANEMPMMPQHFTDSSDLEYSMSSIEYHISRLKPLGIKSSVTSLSRAPTHRMAYGQLDLSDGEILSEGEIRTTSGSETFWETT